MTAPASQVEDGQNVIWLHGADAARRVALCDLGSRIRAQRPEVRIVLTGTGGSDAEIVHANRGYDGTEALVRDNAAEARAFLARWMPSVCLWAGGGFLPTLLEKTRRRDIDMMLVDMGLQDLPRRTRRRWFLNDPVRYSIDLFDAIGVTDEDTRDALRRLGLSGSKISVQPQLKPTALPPPCAAAELTELSNMLAGRPVWLAVHAQPSEFHQILEAHRSALRMAPRLLLAVIPDQPADCVELERSVALSGLHHVNWSDGGEIDAATQVVISDGQGQEPGLWYRTAPIAFVASSFASSTGGRDPEPAAALGAALIHGPNVGQFRPAYETLRRAGAARMVLDARTLAEAVTALTAPDRAARMALAGWQSVTEGAPLIDQLTERVIDRLDHRKAAHART